MEDKETLEKQKLLEEIKVLKQPLLKKISFWASIAPIIVALSAIFFAYKSNLFDLDSKIQELKKENLEKGYNLLKNKEDKLDSNYQRKADSLNHINSNIVNYSTEMSIQYHKLESQQVAKLKSKDEIISYYKMKVDSLTNLIIKSKSIKKMLGEFNKDFNGKGFNKGYLTDDKGNVITDDKGHPILVD